MSAETLRDALLASPLVQGDDPDAKRAIDAIIAAARAESDALRAALETITASLQCEYDGVQGGDRPPYYGNGILYALHVIHKYTDALAPSPAEPAAPEREP